MATRRASARVAVPQRRAQHWAGAIFAHIRGGGLPRRAERYADRNAGAAFKEALSRQTSMTRQVPTGNGIYTQRTEVYRNQGGACGWPTSGSPAPSATARCR